MGLDGPPNEVDAKAMHYDDRSFVPLSRTTKVLLALLKERVDLVGQVLVALVVHVAREDADLVLQWAIRPDGGAVARGPSSQHPPELPRASTKPMRSAVPAARLDSAALGSGAAGG